MEIRYLGQQTVLLKGKKETVVVNPSKTWLDANKKTLVRIIVFSNKKFDTLGLDGERVIVRGPGEYEVGGVELLGLNGGNGDSVYVITIDGVTVGILGELGEPLSDKKIERIDGIDVLMAPTTNNDQISTKLILDWAKRLGANYLLPVGYEEGDEKITKFLDLADRQGLEYTENLKVDKDSLPEGMEVVALKRSNI